MLAILFSAYHFISVTWYPFRQTHDATVYFEELKILLCAISNAVRHISCVCVFVCAQNQMQHIFNKEFKHLRTSNQTCRLPLSGCVVLRFGLALKRSLNVLIPFI